MFSAVAASLMVLWSLLDADTIILHLDAICGHLKGTESRIEGVDL